VRIQFGVPADPAYADRVTGVLSSVYLSKYSYIGGAMAGIGAVGSAAFWLRDDSGGPLVSLFTAMIVVGVLFLLFGPWVRYTNRRRSGGLAVEGTYDITAASVSMTSGEEHHTIDWADVTGVTEVRGFWVLFVGRTPATVIPQEFMSPEEAEALRIFIAARD
jgi:uncharacterized membrane protein